MTDRNEKFETKREAEAFRQYLQGRGREAHVRKLPHTSWWAVFDGQEVETGPGAV